MDVEVHGPADPLHDQDGRQPYALRPPHFVPRGPVSEWCVLVRSPAASLGSLYRRACVRLAVLSVSLYHRAAPCTILTFTQRAVLVQHRVSHLDASGTQISITLSRILDLMIHMQGPLAIRGGISYFRDA